MKNFTLLLIFLFSAIFSFGQTPDFDPSDVSVLKAIRDNAAVNSPLKTEWDDDSPIGSWDGVTWTDSTPRKITELMLNSKELILCDLTKPNKLEQLMCWSNPQLTLLKVTGLSSLKNLSCYSGYSFSSGFKLTTLDLNGLVNLETLDCRGNSLDSLDLSGLLNLQSLFCSGNQLTSLDLKGLTKLHTLDCSNNQLPFSSLKTTLYLPPE